MHLRYFKGGMMYIQEYETILDKIELNHHYIRKNVLE
jgi:hypothetical protein